MMIYLSGRDVVYSGTRDSQWEAPEQFAFSLLPSVALKGVCYHGYWVTGKCLGCQLCSLVAALTLRNLNFVLRP